MIYTCRCEERINSIFYILILSDALLMNLQIKSVTKLQHGGVLGNDNYYFGAKVI